MFHEEITLKLNFSLLKYLGHSFFSSLSLTLVITAADSSPDAEGKTVLWEHEEVTTELSLAIINGSTNHSPHCYETDFHNF